MTEGLTHETLQLLLREQRKTRKLLEQLVGFEGERRAAEQQMEALAAALTPLAAGEPDAGDDGPATVDWHNDRQGHVVMVLGDGSERPATPAEQLQYGRPRGRRGSR